MITNFNKPIYPFGRSPSDRWIDSAWLAIFAGLAALLLTINLGGVALRDWDEGIVAQVAREIWRSQMGAVDSIHKELTWLYPTLGGVPYLNKPTLVHILIAGFYSLWGVNEWTTRLPGALLSSLSVPLVYAIGREVFVLRSPAVFGAAVFLTLLPVARHGRMAMLDGVLLTFYLVMVYCLLRSRRDLRWGLGVGVSFGLMCLTKGAVGFLLGAIALAFIAWDTPRLLASGYLWAGMAIGSAPVALWYWAQWQRYGTLFLNVNLVNQSFSRLWAPVESNSGPIWYYLLEVVKYSAPWLIFLPQAFRQAWENRTLSWAKLVLLCSSFYLLVISLMQTKLPWYVLPVYPAIALGIGSLLDTFWNPDDIKGFRVSPKRAFPKGWVGAFGLLAIAAGLGAGYFAGVGTAPAQPTLAAILGTAAFTLTSVIWLLLQRNSQFILVLIWGCYVSLLMLMMSPHWLWELSNDYPVKPVAALIQQYTPPSQLVLTSYSGSRPSLNFYSDRIVVSARDFYQQRQMNLSAQEAIAKYWKETRNAYLLVDLETLKTANLPSVNQLGRAENLILITQTPR
jgi:4-amino-4-deoxy-L-arabinose transferase-like glycosyltransferase